MILAALKIVFPAIYVVIMTVICIFFEIFFIVLKSIVPFGLVISLVF